MACSYEQRPSKMKNHLTQMEDTGEEIKYGSSCTVSVCSYQVELSGVSGSGVPLRKAFLRP